VSIKRSDTLAGVKSMVWRWSRRLIFNLFVADRDVPSHESFSFSGGFVFELGEKSEDHGEE